jgi:integrase
MSRTEGIHERHSRPCATNTLTKEQRRDRVLVKKTCNCTPSYRAEVYDPRARKKIRESFRSKTEAKAWRSDALGEVRRGRLRATDGRTLREAATAWLEGAENEKVRTRSGDIYKPSALRGYRAALEQRVLPEFGSAKLASIRRRDLQDLADALLASGLSPSTVRNVFLPVRAIYRRAIRDGDATINPTSGLDLPALRGRRDRIATPEEAETLIAVLREDDRAIWATAFYAGLRLGELRALRVENIDLAAGKIAVVASWDQYAGQVEPKSRAGRRTVPIPAVLRDHLDEHLLRLGWRSGLVFGRSPQTPYNPSSIDRRAKRCWAVAAIGAFLTSQPLPVEIQPIGLHEARHTYASLMIAAGVNIKALSTYMGHSSITITLDRYGHLLPGNEEEAAGLLDAFLVRANTAARLAQVEAVGKEKT